MKTVPQIDEMDFDEAPPVGSWKSKTKPIVLDDIPPRVEQPFSPTTYTRTSVTITVAEHERLVDNDHMLEALYAAGVDSWEGYSVAIDIKRDMV